MELSCVVVKRKKTFSIYTFEFKGNLTNDRIWTSKKNETLLTTWRHIIWIKVAEQWFAQRKFASKRITYKRYVKKLKELMLIWRRRRQNHDETKREIREVKEDKKDFVQKKRLAKKKWSGIEKKREGGNGGSKGRTKHEKQQ